MTEQTARSDLVILVADKDMEQAITAICARPDALGIRSVSCQILVHPGRDPGCLREGADFLRPFRHQYNHALIVFDRVGCGREARSRVQLEVYLEQALAQSGWEARGATVVIDPELEVWVWSDSPHVEHVLGWHGRHPALRKWLDHQGYAYNDTLKPAQPKEAMEYVLRTAQIPRSSALYRQLAQKVSLSRCSDASFLKFKTTLRLWFGT